MTSDTDERRALDELLRHTKRLIDSGQQHNIDGESLYRALAAIRSRSLGPAVQPRWYIVEYRDDDITDVTAWPTFEDAQDHRDASAKETGLPLANYSIHSAYATPGASK